MKLEIHLSKNEGVISIEKILLNVKEMGEYLGIGETKNRELLRNPKNGFTVRIGNRLYAHRERLDTWLKQQIL